MCTKYRMTVSECVCVYVQMCVYISVYVCECVSVLVYMCSMKERKMGHQKKFDLKVIFYKDALNTKKPKVYFTFYLHF